MRSCSKSSSAMGRMAGHPIFSQLNGDARGHTQGSTNRQMHRGSRQRLSKGPRDITSTGLTALVAGLDRGLARLSDDLGISGPPALIEPGLKGAIETEQQVETPARNGLGQVACCSCGGLWTKPHRHAADVVRDQIRARGVDATEKLSITYCHSRSAQASCPTPASRLAIRRRLSSSSATS